MKKTLLVCMVFVLSLLLTSHAEAFEVSGAGNGGGSTHSNNYQSYKTNRELRKLRWAVLARERASKRLAAALTKTNQNVNQTTSVVNTLIGTVGGNTTALKGVADAVNTLRTKVNAISDKLDKVNASMRKTKATSDVTLWIEKIFFPVLLVLVVVFGIVSIYNHRRTHGIVEESAQQIHDLHDDLPRPYIVRLNIAGHAIEYSAPAIDGAYQSLEIPKNHRPCRNPADIYRLVFRLKPELERSVLETLCGYFEREANGSGQNLPSLSDPDYAQQLKVIECALSSGQLRFV